MKHTYILKKPVKNLDLEKLDRDRRDKVEEIIGHKLSDKAWLDYKRMVSDKPKN